MNDIPTLTYFKERLDSDLDQVNDAMRLTLSSNVLLIDKVVRYIVKNKGKSLRPILTLLCSRLFGKPDEQAIKIAVIVELLHTATLVHDDVVDDAKVRRGFFSVNAIWKNKVTVLVGDYLLAKALIEMLKLRSFDVLDILGTTAQRMSRGELLQIAKVRKLDITEEVYFDMIGDKTATLMSACCELPAVIAGATPLERQALRGFGEKLGIAFQIRDDILDFEGRDSLMGKPVMGDIKEKKITLPLIHALKQAGPSDCREIKRMIERGLKSNQSKRVLQFIRGFNGIEYATNYANRLEDDALIDLAYFPPSQERSMLVGFVKFARNRKK
jgi:octaprenyl-diphosphate synthase